MIQVTDNGTTKKVADHLGRIEKRFQKMPMIVLRRAARFAKNSAQQRAPIHTGIMRQLIGITEGPRSVSVISVYPESVEGEGINVLFEKGTYEEVTGQEKRTGQYKFMTKAMNETRRFIKKELGIKLKTALKIR